MGCMKKLLRMDFDMSAAERGPNYKRVETGETKISTKVQWTKFIKRYHPAFLSV
jgi:hypothetical protein